MPCAYPSSDFLFLMVECIHLVQKVRCLSFHQTLVIQSLMLSNLLVQYFYMTRSPPTIPEVRLPEDVALGVASALRIEINGALAFLHGIAAGKDVKKFVIVSLCLPFALFSCLCSVLDCSHI